MRIAVQEPTHVAQCRRAIAALAGELRLGETEAGRAAVIATELAGNLLKHGGGGEFHAGRSELGDCGLYMLALDRGQGIRNITDALRDGFSTTGSPGTGLGAVGRLADSFDIFSAPGKGTVVSAALGAGPGCESLAVVAAALEGEAVSGDGWAAERSGQTLRVLLADGLGHGPRAAEAAVTASEWFHRRASVPPESAIGELHSTLRTTRGAAVAVAHVDFSAGQILYAGVGNLSGVVVSGANTRHLVSMAGTAGHTVQRIRQFELGFPPGALLVLHSDGLKQHWNLESYPGLVRHSPRVIAAVLYRDFARGRDDVTVMAAREWPVREAA